MSGNKDLFDELEETPAPDEENLDTDWDDEPYPGDGTDQNDIDPLQEHLDSSEVIRNAKIAYIEDVIQKLNDFFNQEEIKQFGWSIQKSGVFKFRIMRKSTVLAIVKSRGLFNFYNRKLENRIRADKSLKELFDFR